MKRSHWITRCRSAKNSTGIFSWGKITGNLQENLGEHGATTFSSGRFFSFQEVGHPHTQKNKEKLHETLRNQNKCWQEMKWSNKNETYQYSGQIIILHQPGFPWTKENFPSYSLPFGGFWRRYNLTRISSSRKNMQKDAIASSRQAQ